MRAEAGIGQGADQPDRLDADPDDPLDQADEGLGVVGAVGVAGGSPGLTRWGDHPLQGRAVPQDVVHRRRREAR